MRLRRKLYRRLSVALGLLVSLAAAGQELAGLATIDPILRPGLASGRALPAGPFPGQPFQGVSSLEARGDGSYLALLDNGYGRRSNSLDFLLSVVVLEPDWRAGSVALGETIHLTDPGGHWPWPLAWGQAAKASGPDSEASHRVADRILTGADLDPESLALAPDGSWWIGDEFGPFLLHFDERGRLLEPPVSLPGIVSPDHPQVRGASIERSAGFEATALTCDGVLIVLLEKPFPGDRVRQLPLYRFDTGSGRWLDERPWRYLPIGAEATAVGAATASDGYLYFIERDSRSGRAARHKRLLRARLDGSGPSLEPEPLVDLLALPDPHGIAGGERHAMPFHTIESIVAAGPGLLLIANDNNFPFGRSRGGEPGSEPTELTLLRLAGVRPDARERCVPAAPSL